MADNQAEDEDDESFGDFMYVSYPSQPTYSNPMNEGGFSVVDNDWSEFITNTNQINGRLEPFPSHSPSKISTQDSEDYSDNITTHMSKLSQIELAPRPAELEKSRWTKPQGALPLSIFGEEEEDEPSASNLAFVNGAGVFFNNVCDSVKKESDTIGALTMNNIISNLYNQSPRLNFENGSIWILSGPYLNASRVSSNGNSSISIVAASPPNPDANGLNSNMSNLNLDSMDGHEDNDDDDDGWEFKCAEPEIIIKRDNIKVEETKQEINQQVESIFSVGFSNGACDFGSMLNLSNGTSHKVDEWNMDIEFSRNSLLQDHSAPKLGHDNESNNSKTGLNLVNKKFGIFKDAYSESGSNHNSETPKLAGIYPTSEEALKYDGESPSDPTDQSHPSKEISLQSDEWNFGFNFIPPSLGEDHHISESYSNRKENDNNQNSNTASTITNVDSDVQIFECMDANTKIGTQHEKSQRSSENSREALPLSIFGDETPDVDDHSVRQDLSSYAPTSSIKNSFDSPYSNLPINDLIWNLYSQAEHQASPNSTTKTMKNGVHEAHEVLHPSLINSEDGFNDDSWEFIGASSGTRLNSELSNGGDGFENGSWEFKDAFSGTRSQGQATVIDLRNSPMQSSAKLESFGCIDLYCKLKDELSNAILRHLQNLKKVQSIAAVSGEDAKTKALQEEIQEISVMLHKDDIIPKEYLSENHSPTSMCPGQLLEVLKEPKFQLLESEYHLRARLLLAEKEIIPAIELLKHAASTLRILELGSSREEQSNYLASWSKITSVCSHELKHGAFIWKESVQKNVHDQILSNPKGIQYFHALGEIYRVAEIIGASAKLYKPWVLSGSSDATSLFTLLNDCNAIWSGSGLEEALSSMMNQTNFEQDGILRELLGSIKYIHELDEHALQSCVISGLETCQLSALPTDFIPGLKMVAWNGKHYFLTVANLWANLVSSDPPK